MAQNLLANMCDSIHTRTHLCWVHLSLDDVKNSNVAVICLTVSSCGHHDVLGLQESPHHIQNCSLPYTCHLTRHTFILLKKEKCH